MKKLIMLFTMTLVSISFARDLYQNSSLPVQKAARKIQTEQMRGFEKYDRIPEFLLNQYNYPELPGDKIGETTYTYQTNYTLKDRILYDPHSQTIHAIWMFGDIAETAIGFPNRHMFYNHFDGNNWIHGLGVPVENKWAGYGSIELDENNSAVVASHFATGSSIWYDFMAGFGFFSESLIYDYTQHSPPVLNLTWADIAIDKKGTWHVAVTNFDQDEGMTDEMQIVNGVSMNVLYYSSKDRGQTWSSPYALFTDTTTYKFSRPNQALNSKQIEASDLDDEKLGIIVIDDWQDIYFFASEDYGTTWKRGEKILGKNIFDLGDSLTYPIEWDVVIKDSITVDTLLSYDQGPNVDVRPVGDGDLLYVNGEPHVVWNECWLTQDADGKVWYPWGLSDSLRQVYTYLNGEHSRYKLSFFLKHWSPTTGVSTVYQEFGEYNVREWWPGDGAEYIGQPSIGVDGNGNFYCIFTRCCKSDTITEEDGIGQTNRDQGALCFARLWGAKSVDGGKTWNEAVQLINEDINIHQDIRYPCISNRNPKDAVYVLYQNSKGVPWTAIQDDHNIWTIADMKCYKIPTLLFPSTQKYYGPQIKLSTSSKLGGLDFGDIGDTGQVSMTIQVNNVGDELLQVKNIFAGSKAFWAEPASFDVVPGGAQEVTVFFKPLSAEVYDTYLAIPNNDPAKHSIGIPLQGVGLPVHVSNEKKLQLDSFVLYQNYPNPFNPGTTISFSLPKKSNVQLVIYNTLGKEIVTLINENIEAGYHEIQWQPAFLASGLYFYQLKADHFVQTKKMVLMF